MSIIQIYTYIDLYLLSVQLLIYFLMEFLTKDINIYTLYLFLCLLLTHET